MLGKYLMMAYAPSSAALAKNGARAPSFRLIDCRCLLLRPLCAPAPAPPCPPVTMRTQAYMAFTPGHCGRFDDLTGCSRQSRPGKPEHSVLS